MYLIMDNAGYHKPRDETWISDSKVLSKHDLAHQLIDLGVEQLTTANGARVVPAHLFEASIDAGGATKEDLITATKKWLAEHSDCNRTVVEQLLQDAGHSIVYTPPFCPEVQPIELLWAHVKRYVAEHATHNRSITEARAQTEEGFELLTRGFIYKIIAHCHEWIDSFLKTDAAEDLQQCGSLACVIKSLQLLKAASSDARTNAPMDISPPLPPPASTSSRSSPRRR